MDKHPIIDRINQDGPGALHALTIEEKKALAQEARAMIMDTVSRNGGHLASNLGVVELTIALLDAFNPHRCPIIWDVGHQSYTYKLLTGRADRFDTLRTEGGIAGYPKREESSYDRFNTGHSSTSISAALGILRARKLRGQSGPVVAIIGDGALTGGMAIEALNDAGQYSEQLIVILNDNQMSIDPIRGGMAQHLRHIRLSRTYLKLKSRMDTLLKHIPLLGRPISRAIEFSKENLRRMSRPFPVIFEDIGFKYYGPVDGHDFEDLDTHLETIRGMEGPVLLHVCTQKGRGYSFAEESPDVYHGVAPFEIQKGVNGSAGVPETGTLSSYSEAFGVSLSALAEANERIVAISAAMFSGTGLAGFAARYPNRVYDVCIAEQHAVTMACGMASEGIVPVVAIYSTFLQRAFDQILHDAALQRLHVVFAIDRAGVVGEDGETHQGVYDVAYLMLMPGMELFAPRDYRELEGMLDYAVNIAEGPVAIRYPRGPERRLPGPPVARAFLPLDRAEVLREGAHATIVACGAMVRNALLAADMLEEEGLRCEVIDIRRVKPMDEETVLTSCRKTKHLITVEDGTRTGGFGEHLATCVAAVLPSVPISVCATGDHPVLQGSITQILKREGLDPDGIADTVRRTVSAGPNTTE